LNKRGKRVIFDAKKKRRLGTGGAYFPRRPFFFFCLAAPSRFGSQSERAGPPRGGKKFPTEGRSVRVGRVVGGGKVSFKRNEVFKKTEEKVKIVEEKKRKYE